MKYGILVLVAAAALSSCQPASDKIAADQLLLYLSKNVIVTDEAKIKSVYGVEKVDPSRIYFATLNHARQLVNLEQGLGYKLKGVDREKKVLLYELPAGHDLAKLDEVTEALASLSLIDNTLFLKKGAKKDLTAFAPVDHITNYWSVPAAPAKTE